MNPGISCEIPAETMSTCVHGVPVKFECGRCEDKHRLNFLESRVDEIVQFRNSHLECWNVLDEKINDINKSFNDALEVYHKDFNKRIKEIERFQDITHKQFYDVNKKPYKCPVCDGSIKILIDPSTPLSGIQSMFGKRDENGMYYKDCKSCEGSGILWG